MACYIYFQNNLNRFTKHMISGSVLPTLANHALQRFSLANEVLKKSDKCKGLRTI